MKITDLLNECQPIKEGLFEYIKLEDAFEVTVNFIEAGSAIPSHTHEQDVINYVFAGEFEVEMAGENRVFKQGEWLKIPAGEPHAVLAGVDTQLLELWRK